MAVAAVGLRTTFSGFHPSFCKDILACHIYRDWKTFSFTSFFVHAAVHSQGIFRFLSALRNVNGCGQFGSSNGHVQSPNHNDIAQQAYSYRNNRKYNNKCIECEVVLFKVCNFSRIFKWIFAVEPSIWHVTTTLYLCSEYEKAELPPASQWSIRPYNTTCLFCWWQEDFTCVRLFHLKWKMASFYVCVFSVPFYT